MAEDIEICSDDKQVMNNTMIKKCYPIRTNHGACRVVCRVRLTLILRLT